MVLVLFSKWFQWTKATFQTRKTCVPPLLQLQKLEDRSLPSGVDLGFANNFNVFVFDDFKGCYSDIQGRIAIGDDANLTGYSVGDHLENSKGTRDDLIVQGDLKYTNGQVFNGNLVYGSTAQLKGVGVPNGKVRKQLNVVDFSAAKTDLETKSLTWSQFVPNGEVEKHWGSLTLRGQDPNINVFDLTSADLHPCYGMTLHVPGSSTVLINISGSSPVVQFFWINLNGSNPNRVLFNFHDAQTLKIQGIAMQGSVLAPFAEVNFSNGDVNGTLVAESFSGSGQFHDFPNQLTVVPPPVINSSLGGKVFELRERFQVPLSGVTIILTGTNDLGTVNRDTTTDTFGNFYFNKLRPGTYHLSIILPDGFQVQQVFVGSLGGTPGHGSITGITIDINDDGSGYNFGLVPL